MTTRKALTPAQVKARFRERGITVTQWAAKHNFRREAVYRVIGGQDKGNFGQAHHIAVALGLKVPSDEPITTTPARNTQARQAA